MQMWKFTGRFFVIVKFSLDFLFVEADIKILSVVHSPVGESSSHEAGSSWASTVPIYKELGWIQIDSFQWSCSVIKQCKLLRRSFAPELFHCLQCIFGFTIHTREVRAQGLVGKTTCTIKSSKSEQNWGHESLPTTSGIASLANWAFSGWTVVLLLWSRNMHTSMSLKYNYTVNW